LAEAKGAAPVAVERTVTTLLSEDEVEVRVTTEAVERTVDVEGSSVEVEEEDSELEEGEGDDELDELVGEEEGRVVVLRVVVVAVTGATVVFEVVEGEGEAEEDDDLVRGVAKGVVELEAARVVGLEQVVVP
jgi:hypothetical protein